MNHLRLCALVGLGTMEQFAFVQHEDYTTMIWFAALICTFLGTSKVDGVESRIFITPQLSDPMQSNIFSTNILQYLLRTNKTDEKKPNSQTTPINHNDNVDDDMKSATALLEDIWLPKINNLSKTSEVFKETYNKTSIDYITNIKEEINIIDNKTVSDDEKHAKNNTKGTNIMSINKFGIKDPNKLFENNIFKNNSNSNVINSEPSYKLLLNNQTDKNATIHEHNIDSDTNTRNMTFYTAISNNHFKLLQENKTEEKVSKSNNSEHNTSEKIEILERRLEKELNNMNISQNPQMLEIMKTITNNNRTQSFTAETNNNNTSNTPRLLYFLNEEEAPENKLSLPINTKKKLDTVSETEPRKSHKVCVNNLQNQTQNASTVPLYSIFEKMNPKIKVPSPLDSSELDKSTETQYTRRKNLNHLNDVSGNSSEISSSDLPFSYRGNVLTLEEYLSSLLKNDNFQRINNSLILDKINGTDVLKKVTVYKNSGNHGEVSKVNSTDKNNITVNKCNTNSQTITVNNVLTSNKVNVNFIVSQEVWKSLIKKFNNNSAHSKENNEKPVHVSYKEPEYTFTLRNITNDAFFENEFFYNNIDDNKNNNNDNNNNNTNINNNSVNKNNTNSNNGIKNNNNNNNYNGNNNNNNISNNNGNNNNNINKNNNNIKDNNNNNNFDNSKNNNSKNKDGNTNFGKNKNNESKNKDSNNYFKNSKSNRSHNKNNYYYFRNSKNNGKKSKDDNNERNTNKYEVGDDVDDDVGNDNNKNNNNNRGKNNNENSNINNNNNVDTPTKNITDTLLFKSSYYNNVTDSKSNLKVYVANIQENKKNKMRTLVNRKLKAYSHREIENPPLNIISGDLPKSVILSQKNNIKIFPTNVSLSPEITKDILQTIVNKTTHYATIPILNKQLVNSETNNIPEIPNKYSRVVKDTTNDTIMGNQDDSSKNLFFEFIKNNKKFNSLIENNHVKRFSDNLYCLFFDNNICDYKLYFVYNQTVSKCSSVNYARLIFKSNKNKHLNLIITKYKLAKPFLFLNNTLINNQKSFYMNYAEPKIILVKSLIESNMSLFICNFKNNTFKPVPNKELLKYINQFFYKPKFVYKRNRSIERPILKTKDVNTTFKSNGNLTNLHGNAKSHNLSSVTNNVSETILKVKNNVTDVNYGNSMPVTIKKTRIITRKYINNHNKNKKINNSDYYIQSKSHLHNENNSNTTGCTIDKGSANVTVEVHNKNLTTLTISDINKLLDKYFPDNNITITSNNSSHPKNAQIRNIFNIILNEILKTNPKFNYTKDFLELANSLNITDNTSFINNSRILNSKSFINGTNLNNSINYLIGLINESEHISPYIQYVIETQIENCKRRKGIINGTFEDSRQSIFDNLRSINLCMNRFFNISMKNFKLWLNYTKRHLNPNFKIYEEFERFYRHRYKFFAMRTRNSTKSNNVTTAGIKGKNIIPYIKSNSFNGTNHNKTTKVLNNPQINTIKKAQINGTKKPDNNTKHKYYLQRHTLKSNISVSHYNRHNKSSLNKPNIYKSNTKGVHKSNVKYSYRYPLLQKNLKHEKEKSYTELKQKHITRLNKMRCLKKKNNWNHFNNQTVYAKNMIVKNI